MASSNTSDLDIVIRALALHDYYPEKLSREQLFEITELSIQEKENITQDNISWHFINRITRLNSNARGLKLTSSAVIEKPVGFLQRRTQEKTDTATNFHPLDVLTAVFVCCDSVAKQELVTFLWNCKLAVPFILQPDKAKHPFLYKWPLRQLIMKWQDKGEETSKEHPIFKYPMNHVAFVRIGQCDESKSQLINGLISGPERALGPMFFHRDLSGSKKQRSDIVDGLVELAWYFPKGSDADTFKRCLSFANLRGDATELKEQAKFLCDVFNVVVVVSHSRYLGKARGTLSEFLASQSNVVLVLTDNEITEQENKRIEELLACLGEYAPNKFEILIFEENRLAEKIEMLTIQINKMLTQGFKSIEQYCHEMFTNTIGIDEYKCEKIMQALEYADMIVDTIRSTPEEKRKGIFLPIQGKSWKEWTKLEMEIHRLDEFRQTDSGQDTSSYRDKLEEDKSKFREEQVTLIESSLSNLMTFFISCLDNFDDKNRLQIFLRTLKLGLDDLSRKALSPCYERYQSILNKKTNANTTENAILNTQLAELDERKSLVSFGLEHFSRELGQIFEACMQKRGSNYTISLGKSRRAILCSKIPRLAAKLLIHGYPIEIMDGDVGFVPEVWVKHVLQATRYVLRRIEGEEPKLHVISVLGIQSSGKSTLLNTMFGLQFAVSAGRCTKGVFMQMVNISESLRKSFGCDYLLAIDTEGLRSAQLSSARSVMYDNELSCFAIGLADTTIVNLMGENATYLEENLPIVVHAFLRMDMAGLKPRCTIVHHNVDKRDKDKLTEQTRLLEKVLNDLTKKACDIEKISPPKQFKEIIEFDINGHIDYIPSLFEGEKPMASISIGYSQECNELRKKLLRQIKLCSRRMKMSHFATHLENLWNAIKKDQFVFEFKSTLETEARIHLDEYYCQLYSSLLESVTSIGEKADDTISKCSGKMELEVMFDSTIKTIASEVDVAVTQCRLKLVRYMEEPNKLLACTLRSWKDEVLKQFDSEFKETRLDFVNQIRALFESKLYEQKIPTIQSTSSDDINDLKAIIDCETSKGQITRIRSTNSLVESIWCRWKICIAMRQLKTNTTTTNMPNIAGDAERIVYDMFKSHGVFIGQALEKKSLKMHTLKDFTVEWRHLFLHERVVRSPDMVDYIPVKKELETIRDNVINVVDFELKNIRKGRSPYSASLVKRILMGMKKITDRNRDKCSNVFTIDLSLAVAGYTVTELYEMNDIDNKYTNIIHSLDKGKEDYIRIIRSLLKGNETKLEEVSKSIIQKITLGIIRQLLPTIPRNNREIIRLKSIQKGKMINLLLYGAVLQNNIRLIEMYRADPESALQHYIRKCIRVETLASDAERFVRMKVVTMQNILEDSPRWEGYESSILIWLHRVFLYARLDSFYYDEHLALSMIRGIDVLALSAHVLENLESSHSEICEAAKQFVHKNGDAFTVKTSDHFTDKYLGCGERCPFCNEVCIYSSKNHTGPHQAYFHRPIGSKGFYYVQTNSLSLDTCERLVASDVYVTINKTKIPFKRYQELFPKWLIRADPTLKASAFWKWYFVNVFKIDETKGSDIKLTYPSSWKTITQYEVLQQLQVDE